MAIYSFSPFGYEGSLVTVECDIRKGIPSIDIVGLSDGQCKESRERIKEAIANSGFEFPTERVLLSLSPADLKKDGAGFDLPMCLAVLSARSDYPRSQDANVLVMGEVELSGNLRPVRAVYSALCKAVEAGIRYAIVPEGCETATPKGITVSRAKTLYDAYYLLQAIDEDNVYGEEPDTETKQEETEMNIEFNEIKKDEPSLDSVEGMNGLKYAMAVAAAGGHHLFAWGRHGCGKPLALTHFPELLPHLTVEESESTTRIHSIAGLLNPNQNLMKVRPFRMPHPTASMEGMCGGGANVRPGEISLTHNGVLFLDEAAEFRSAVLQMLRVPLETGAISITRAGRATVYPAKFQLVMAATPCPCGNLGNPEKVCLCSMRAVEQYWRKFSAPLLDRIAIRFNCGKEDKTPNRSLEKLRGIVSIARECQYKRQGKVNQYLSPVEVSRLFDELDGAAKDCINKVSEEKGYSPREISEVLKVARTLADMMMREKILDSDIYEAAELHGKLPIDFE